MKAVILVGGQGTRLRPLTLSTPKPLISLVNRPFLDHLLNPLRLHGITDVVLAMAYRSELFEEAYGDGSRLGMKLQFVHETEPLDTGGAIKNVEQYLAPGETFMVFNGDVLTDLDLSDMMRFHRENGSACTISLTQVDDTSQYGVVDMDARGHIQRFTEKPKREETTSHWINAGTYVLEPEVLEYIPAGARYSVERGLFPTLLKDGKPLYGYRTDAYWLDIGTPAKYLQAQADLLAGSIKDALQPQGEPFVSGVWAGEGTFIASGAQITGPVVLGAHCTLDDGAQIAGPVTLGDGCRVEKGAKLERVIALDGAQFGENSHCTDSIVGSGARIGANCRLEGIAMIGDEATIGEGNHLSNGVKVWPGKTLPAGTLVF